MAFEKVELNNWKPEKDNDSIEGILIKVEEDVGVNKSKLYHIEVEGKPVAVWGSAVLDTKMTATRVGDLIKIVYLGKGEAKGGHNAPKLFDVYIDYEHRDKIAAEAAAVAPAEVAPVAPAAPAAPTQATPAPATPAQA